jgi:GT2 family glycosyltransferase
VGKNDLVGEPPSVTVVIPNWNGAHHLRDCLNSLAQLDFPRDRLDVIVVDNGSTDESLELLRTSYPWVASVALGQNLGFAEASNRGAAQAGSECLAFLNNDTRVDPGWLTHLVSQYDPKNHYVCVAGAILNWDGDQIDFVDGWINFHASADQQYLGVSTDETLIVDGSDMPFACGASMLIERKVFLAVGGFDSRYFAFFEDVDLGWRLWLTGHKVRLSAQARSFHRGHGSASGLPLHQLVFLWERNPLLTLIKNVSDEHLAATLAAATLLLVHRAQIASGSARSAFVVGAEDRASDEVVSRTGLAGPHAVADLMEGLEDVLAERRRIQQMRRRSDEEIFELFQRPFAPVLRDAAYLEGSLRLRAALGLDKPFTRQRIVSVLVISPNESNRMRVLAQSASTFASVVFASPSPPARLPGVNISVTRGESHLAELLAQSDCVVIDAVAGAGEFVAQKSRGLVAVDLADVAGSKPNPGLLRRADLFFCRSEQARAGVIRDLESNSHGLATGEAARRVIVLPDEGEGQKRVLQAVIREPWRWQRDVGSPAGVAVPEDLQLLLRTWREHYMRIGRTRRVARAVWRRLPTQVQRAVFGVTRRF